MASVDRREHGGWENTRLPVLRRWEALSPTAGPPSAHLLSPLSSPNARGPWPPTQGSPHSPSRQPFLPEARHPEDVIPPVSAVIVRLCVSSPVLPGAPSRGRHCFCSVPGGGFPTHTSSISGNPPFAICVANIFFPVFKFFFFTVGFEYAMQLNFQYLFFGLTFTVNQSAFCSVRASGPEVPPLPAGTLGSASPLLC